MVDLSELFADCPIDSVFVQRMAQLSKKGILEEFEYKKRESG